MGQDAVGEAATSFAADAVRRLGARLDTLQEQHEWAAVSSDAVTTQESNKQQKSPSTGDVDVANITSSLQSAKNLQVALYQHTKREGDAVELARVTYAACGVVLDRLLKDAERVNDQAWYWMQIEEDPSRTIMYLVQTFPARLMNLASALARALTPTQQTTSTTKLDRDSIKKAWRLLRDSPVLVIGALFPHTVRRDSGQTAQKLLVARARALSPLGLTRHEAKTKRKRLLQERDQLAMKLGSLAQSLATLQQKTSVQGPEQLLAELQDRIYDMKSALGESSTSTSMSAAADLSTSLNAVLSQHLTTQQARVDGILSPSPHGSGPPSAMARLWPSFVLAPLGTIIVIRVVTTSWDTIVSKTLEAKETAKGFAINWVYEPCLKLLDTIRTGDQDGVIMSKESLNSDLQSLERMVTEFSAEMYGLKGPELDAITQRVREGDLTTVLKIYENELKSPLKSAVTGSLIRTLLIQVQKVKVDIAVAMRGVDQLLKSQQLLFGAIGIAPAMGITYFIVSSLKYKFSTALGQRGKEVSVSTRFRAWEAMRRIDRLLADPNLTSGPLPPLTQGLLLLDLSTLRNLSPILLSQVSRGRKGTAKHLRLEFLQDVRDLETPDATSESASSISHVGLGWHARRAAVDRMWKSWGSVMSLVDT